MFFDSSCLPHRATVSPPPPIIPGNLSPGSSGDEENVPTTNARTPTLVKGQPLPPPKQQTIAALNGFELDNMSDCKVIYTGEDVPGNLQAMDSLSWKDSKYLKKTFKRLVENDGEFKCWKEVNRRFPGALLFAAYHMTDRLILINWWIQQSKEELKKADVTLYCLFVRPSVSASPLKIDKSVVDAVVRQKLAKKSNNVSSE